MHESTLEIIGGCTASALDAIGKLQEASDEIATVISELARLDPSIAQGLAYEAQRELYRARGALDLLWGALECITP